MKRKETKGRELFLHARYPRHSNKLAQNRRLNSAFSMWLRVEYMELRKFAAVSYRTEITGLGVAFPQLSNFQGHTPTALGNNILTA